MLDPRAGMGVAAPLTSVGGAVVADEASRRTAVGTTRTGIVTGFLGLGALLGLVINNTSARAAIASAEAAVANSRVAFETLRVTERGHLTDRYAKAIEQIGDDKLAVRLGGIYGLQQYVEDSDRPGDQRTVVEVLSAFVRDKLDGFGGSDPGRGGAPGPDVLAAVSVLAQLPHREGVVRAYISGSLFHSVDISEARLRRGDFRCVRIDSVFIRCADLTRINLDGADFEGARMIRCNLTRASLRGTILRMGIMPRSTLHRADLEGADLGAVNFEDADFTGANLRNANLSTADLSWANLSSVDLTGARFFMTNFRGANLDGAQIEDGQLTAEQIASAENVPSGLKPKQEEDAA